MFDLLSPCVTCPFRLGVGSRFQFSQARLDQIRSAPAFQCHKTVDYSATWQGEPGGRPQQCAGLMAVLLHEDEPNQIMQVALRLEALKAEAVDGTTAYASWEEVLRAHLDGVEPKAASRTRSRIA